MSSPKTPGHKLKWLLTIPATFTSCCILLLYAEHKNEVTGKWIKLYRRPNNDPHNTYDQTKETEVSTECRTHPRNKKCQQNISVGKPE
jgi:hypothetical protein